MTKPLCYPFKILFKKTGNLSVRNHPPDVLQIRRVQQARLSEIPFPFCALLGEDMTRKSFVPHDFSSTAGFKTLGCTAVGLHFRHYCPPLLINALKKKTALLSIFAQGKRFSRKLFPA
jgi:hypothetical protein